MNPVNFNPAISAISPKPLHPAGPMQQPDEIKKTDFGSLVKQYMENAEQSQQASDAAIRDMIAGKSTDINSVVAEVAKADMSFKLMVGVRNKIIEAYKQTMQMQI